MCTGNGQLMLCPSRHGDTAEEKRALSYVVGHRQKEEHYKMLEPEIEPHARDARAFIIVCSARLEIIPPAVMAASQRRYLILEETI